MKKYLLIVTWLGILSSFFVNMALADLKLIITKGMVSAVPIAVAPFAQQENQNDHRNNTLISTVIHSDLKNSGHFNVMPTAEMNQHPMNFSDVQFGYWKKTGNEYLVIGNIKNVGDDQYQITFSLLNILLGVSGQSQSFQNPIVVSKRFIISKSQFRNLAHLISDIIYQEVTGVRGVFSTEIAYVLVQRATNSSAKYMLEVADADGFNPKALVTSDAPLMSPAWSPDGKKIAYVSLANTRASIYIVDVATGEQQLISDSPGINGAPAWSPDGKKLALVLSKTGHPKIFLFDLQTKQLTQLTFGMSIDTEPSWDSNGKSFVFTSNRGGTPQIYRYSMYSNKISRISFDGNYNATASFIAQDKKIIALHQSQNGFNIAVQDLSSGAISVITHNGYDSSPSAAPNGQMVIYANDQTLNGTLGIVSIDGKVQLQLPAPEGTVQEPAWSPYLTS